MSYFSTHNHSDFSSLKFPDSICKIGDLIDRAYQLGLSGLAITDHDCISSYIRAEEHVTKQKKKNPDDEGWKNFKLALGNEIYLCRNGLGKDNFTKGEDKYFHMVLIAKNKKGNQQIRELSTRAWSRSYMVFHRRTPTYFSDLDEIVATEPGNIISTSACLGGQLPYLILRSKEARLEKNELAARDYDQATLRWIEKIQSIFGKEDFYLELQPGLSEEQIYVNKELVTLGQELGIKCILATDTHYLRAEDRKIHKAYLTSKRGEREVDDFYEAAYMMTKDEMAERMVGYLGEDIFNNLIKNTLEIRDKCEDYSLLNPLNIPYTSRGRKEEPELSILIGDIPKASAFSRFLTSSEAADRQLAARLYKYLKSKDTYGDYETNFKKLDYELNIIWDSSIKNKVCWSRYLVQMANYLDIIWNEGNSIVCPGRGSAGASLVMYALEIIQINPLREQAPLIFERFINPERASVLDVDIDVESVKRNSCISALQAEYGKDKVVRVCTFKTEKAKSAILAAARGVDVDIDTARYIAGLVGSERGQQYTLTDMYYGNEEKDLLPNKTFIKEVDQYPDLWEIAQRIEGLNNGLGIHAGGVIIVDEPFTNTCSIMATTKGELISAFDLHDAEKTGLIKIDLLATEGLSKIRVCLDSLCDHGYIEREATLKETYEKVIGVYNLERDNRDIWEMVWNNEIISLFQMEQPSGIQGIALTKPKSLEDLATLNSVMRLMAPEKGAEQPLSKYARFRENPDAWDKEMDEYGLREEEKSLLHNLLDYSNGICAQQEDLYQLLTNPTIAGFGLGKADILRKAVAKKSPEDYKKFEVDYWENMREKNLSQKLCRYVWDVLIASQRG